MGNYNNGNYNQNQYNPAGGQMPNGQPQQMNNGQQSMYGQSQQYNQQNMYGQPQQYNQQNMYGQPQQPYNQNMYNQPYGYPGYYKKKSNIVLIAAIIGGLIILFSIISMWLGIVNSARNNSDSTSYAQNNSNSDNNSGSSNKYDKDNDDTSTEALVSESYFASHNWVGTSGNSSYLVTHSDGTFEYYRDKDDTDDYYYTGTYVLLTGEAAYEYITEDLEDLGVTKKELDNIMANNEEYDYSTLVCLILNNEECIIDGENTMEESVVSTYMGFSYEQSGKKYISIAHMETAGDAIVFEEE